VSFLTGVNGLLIEFIIVVMNLRRVVPLFIDCIVHAYVRNGDFFAYVRNGNSIAMEMLGKAVLLQGIGYVEGWGCLCEIVFV
jgi:hypothetical protein